MKMLRNGRNVESAAAVGLDVQGFAEAIANLQGLGKKINPILRRAARTSSTPIAQAMKSMLKVRGKRSIYSGKKVFTYGLTGLLRKSIGIRVNTKSKLGGVYANIGPRYAMGGYAFKAWHKPTKSARKLVNAMVSVNPVYYAHLVNNGFNAKLFGTGRVKRVSGIHFIERAYAAARSQVAFTTARILTEEVDKAMNQ